jgi:hypothetical protein
MWSSSWFHSTSVLQDIKERLNTLEAELAESRNLLALGYKDPKVNSPVTPQEPL